MTSSTMVSIEQVNQLDQPAFVALLGFVFEQTPELAAQAWKLGPFTNRSQLHQVLTELVKTLPQANQLRLICAHPDLGSRLAMAETSVQEQSGAGLDQLTPQEYHQFSDWNAQYKQRFGFPFIIAVRNHSKPSILSAFERRLTHDRPTEQATALQEIIEIARFRLEDTIA
jgi:2-oxo-4-hydroxy-4-carboxy-5-ureidoimidazoline decarboxylase